MALKMDVIVVGGARAILQKMLIKQGARIFKVVPKSVIEKYRAYKQFFNT